MLSAEEWCLSVAGLLRCSLLLLLLLLPKAVEDEHAQNSPES